MSAGAGAEPSLTPSSRALELLRQTFGLAEFRAGQAEAVAAAEAGRDLLLVAPTGAGKSLAYWVPGLLGEGLTLVVSPLISLMADQLARLRSLSVPAAAINSQVSPEDQRRARAAAAAGGLRFLYVAPERFAAPGFLELLASWRVSRLVVDEAHCISSWGHDFRPEYRRLGEAVRACGRPAVSAFTATATPRVRSDIAESLGLRQPLVRVTGFARPELLLRVIRCRGERAKLAVVARSLGVTGSAVAAGEALRVPPGRAIVYCGRTRSTEAVASHLRSLGTASAAYHGSLGAQQRRRVQQDFVSGGLQVVAATSAFGMGIDLPDIRQVIHLDFPGSIEAYYQEAGRAGRDGHPALCTLLYSAADRELHRHFIAAAHPERQVVRDVHRQLLRQGDWTATGWEQQLTHLSRHQIRAALELLRRAEVSATAGRWRRWLEPPVDFDEQDRLRQLAHARLGQMMAYATSRGCRRARISSYFGAEDSDQTCRSCDNCELRGTRRLVPVESGCVLDALRCVRALDGRLGATRLARILVGSPGAVPEGPTGRPTPGFAALGGWPQQRARDLLGELVESGCLVRRHGELPTLGVAPLGRRVLAGQAEVRIELDVPPSPGMS